MMKNRLLQWPNYTGSATPAHHCRFAAYFLDSRLDASAKLRYACFRGNDEQLL